MRSGQRGYGGMVAAVTVGLYIGSLQQSAQAYTTSKLPKSCKTTIDPPDDGCVQRRKFLESSSLAAFGALSGLTLAPWVVDAMSSPLKTSDKETTTERLQGVDVRTPTLSSSSSLELSSEASMAPSPPATTTLDLDAVLKKATKKALGGGKAGASAAVVQVCSLMWLRTAMNYQYRYGGNLQSSLQTLMEEGGIPRLYQGLPLALIQGPLTRFGDTAANVGVMAFLDTVPETAVLPLPVKTFAGSLGAGLWRIFLMPIDTSKTTLQVLGKSGLEQLYQRVGVDGPGVLYSGALAVAGATAVGHFPWFLTYNYLNEQLPTVDSSDNLLLALLRSALLGLSASCVSDCTSNSLRVLKTTKQTGAFSTTKSTTRDDTAKSTTRKDEIEEESNDEKGDISYAEALQLILDKDGVRGLLGRGLQTRLLTNAIQGAAFSVLWKYFQTMNQV